MPTRSSCRPILPPAGLVGTGSMGAATVGRRYRQGRRIAARPASRPMSRACSGSAAWRLHSHRRATTSTAWEPQAGLRPAGRLRRTARPAGLRLAARLRPAAPARGGGLSIERRGPDDRSRVDQESACAWQPQRHAGTRTRALDAPYAGGSWSGTPVASLVIGCLDGQASLETTVSSCTQPPGPRTASSR